jgi:CHAT domain
MEGPFTYQDFDLLIEPASASCYRARVLRSPAGESSPVQFTLPFSRVELENLVLKVGHWHRRVRGPGRPEIAPLKDFGGKLYGAVFKDEVRDTLLSSLSQTRKQGTGMRLRLRLTDTPELAELPWEFLYDPRLNRFLALSRRTPLVRYLDLPDPPRSLAVAGPLRLLVMISSPSDWPALDVEQEWSLLTGALAPQQEEGRVIVERLVATMSTLRERLRREQFHVFHFLGHGHYRPDWGDGVLVMEDRNGRSHEVTGDELGGLLNEYDTTRLAVLNACEGARGGASDPFAGMAQSLIQQGLPAVVAMQFEITDAAAIIFAREFYGAIADGYSLEAAMAEARGAIRDEGNPVEWGTPVLYSRATDGRLFDQTGRPRIPAAHRQAQEDADRHAREDAEHQGVPAAALGTEAIPRSPSAANAEVLDVPSDGNALGQASGKDPIAVRHDPDCAAQLGADAERIAQSITDKSVKSKALADIARALAATDPARAAQLGADAEAIALRIADKSLKPTPLVYITRALAATDPDRAERITQSIADEFLKGPAVASIARALAATDPDRAAQLGADAERIAQSIARKKLRQDKSAGPLTRAANFNQFCADKEDALASIARALAATDPDRAERIAQSIGPKFFKFYDGKVFKATVLADMARALAATDPARAHRLCAKAERIITWSGMDQSSKSGALARIAWALAATNPARAEVIALGIADKSSKATALAHIARAVAATDPDRAASLGANAERIAQSIAGLPSQHITEKFSMAAALADIARVLAATDPDRAERIARSITVEFPMARALADIARALAATDPDRAERIARSITVEYSKATALAHIAKAVAATDPDRAVALGADAERIAQSIALEYSKGTALADIARALAAADGLIEGRSAVEHDLTDPAAAV